MENDRTPGVSKRARNADKIMESVATALSHDIKSVIGTIGRKIRLILGSEKFRKHYKSHELEIGVILKEVTNLYNTSESIRDSVREQRIKDRAELSAEISRRMLGIFPAIKLEISKLDEAGIPKVFPDDFEAFRLSVIRVEKILRSISGSLQEGAGLSFVQTNIANHIIFARQALSGLINLNGADVRITGTATILADQGSILSIFINLIDNSLKYRSKIRRPEISLAITKGNLDYIRSKYHGFQFSAISPNEWVIIEVSDNGKGISLEAKAKIFEFGYREDHSEYKEDSFGFGLTRCRDLIELHNGRIFLKKSDSNGSEFTIILPMDPRLVRFYNT